MSHLSNTICELLPLSQNTKYLINSKISSPFTPVSFYRPQTLTSSRELGGNACRTVGSDCEGSGDHVEGDGWARTAGRGRRLRRRRVAVLTWQAAGGDYEGSL